MAWSYRKRIKIIPGVHVNLSKSGISTTIGVKGLSVNISPKGKTLNQSIPGTGLYNRQRIPNPIPTQKEESYIFGESEIFSSDVEQITSQNMKGVKEAILLSIQQRSELKKDLSDVKLGKLKSNLTLWGSYALIFGFINKNFSQKIKTDIQNQHNAINAIQQQIENSFVDLNVDFDPDTKRVYEKFLSSFKNLIESHKIWDVTSEAYQDSVRARSSASRLVNKKIVKFDFGSIPEIRTSFEIPRFKNANGGDLYFYPNFIVIYSGKSKFAVIGYDELSLFHSYIRFVERGSIPRDTQIIDHTWNKVNKNGTPDKRFKGNFQIPVVKYGEISLKTATGLNEEYQISNYMASENFGNSFKEFQNLFKNLRGY